MPSTSLSAQGIDRDALLRVVEPIVHGHGAELVELEFRPERGGWVLRLYVEKEGAAERGLSTRDAAVNLELCAGISRDLSPALDVADLVPHAYQLEVSSPGVERPLRGERDFIRFAGERAKLKLREALPASEDGKRGVQRVVVGTLEGLTDGRIRVREGKRTHDIPLSNVESARLVFELGAPAKRH
ncbi:MAG: ribosome maturation factor RimP [Polyangiaceae bacterium]|nr:ribosome maturation factor RimP [Polyangiaceae bacterium]